MDEKLDEELTRNRCERGITLYEKKEVSCCEYIYTSIKYHDERVSSNIKILLFSIPNSILIYVFRLLYYNLIDGERKIFSSTVKNDNLIFYFVF